LVANLFFAIQTSTRLSLSAFNVAALIEYLSSLLVESTRSYTNISTGIAYFKGALLFLAKQWYFYKNWNVVFGCTFVLRVPSVEERAHDQKRALFVICR
jgi:hypothetical protein